MTIRMKIGRWLGAAVLTCCTARYAVMLAQTPKSVSPDPAHETIELENEQVRVIRVKLPPHTKSPMHPHPNRVVIPLTVQRSRATTSEGAVDERSRQPGQVFWGKANS